jgi:hypothetical protein
MNGQPLVITSAAGHLAGCTLSLLSTLCLVALKQSKLLLMDIGAYCWFGRTFHPPSHHQSVNRYVTYVCTCTRALSGMAGDGSSTIIPSELIDDDAATVTLQR